MKLNELVEQKEEVKPKEYRKVKKSDAEYSLNCECGNQLRFPYGKEIALVVEAHRRGWKVEIGGSITCFTCLEKEKEVIDTTGILDKEEN